MERNFSQARLNALRMQLDPHFLFNALNTISSQVERNPRLARTMIEHLGDLLRLSLDARDRRYRCRHLAAASIPRRAGQCLSHLNESAFLWWTMKRPRASALSIY
jgi:hypothetical protein